MIIDSLSTFLFNSTLLEKKLLLKYYFTNKPAKGPVEEKDLGLVRISFNFERSMSELRNVSQPFSVNVIGEVMYNSENFDIFEINFNPQGMLKLMVIAGMHGNETSGFLAVSEILTEIKNNSDYYKDFNIKIISPLNPVGVRYNSRYNGQGVDINRDFKKFESQESRLLKEITDKFSPEIVINLHEGPQDKGMFMFVNLKTYKSQMLNVLQILTNRGVVLSESTYLKDKLKVPGLAIVDSSYYKILMKITGLFGVGYYSDYCSRRGVFQITTEVSWRFNNTGERIQNQVEVIKAVCMSFKSFEIYDKLK